jgi:hypothetical protein
MKPNARSTFLGPTLLSVGFFAIPVSLAYIYPASFWTLTDYEPLGLADAMSMAYRLADLRLYFAQGLSGHPGVPFYFLSWFALALTGHPIAWGDAGFFRDVLDHVTQYHLAIRVLAALVGAAGVYIFCRVALRLVPAGVVLVAVLLWLVSTPFTLAMFFSASIDSFALILNALFLVILVPLAYEDEIDTNLLVLAGFVGALAYLNKLSYIYVPIALYAAAFVKIVGSGIGWLRHFRLMGVYIGSLLLVVYSALFLVLGRQTMHGLYVFQTGVFWGTGLYGTGDQTIVSEGAIWHAIASVPIDRAYAVLIALIGGAALAIGGLFTWWKRPQHLPVAVISIAAGDAAALSALFVLKHYGGHYTGGIAATLPACVVAGYLLLGAWGVRLQITAIAGGAVTAASVIALLFMASEVRPVLAAQFEGQALRAREAEADLQEIKKYMARDERGFEFGYSSPLREYGEGFVVDWASVPRMTYEYFQSHTKLVSSPLTKFISRDIGVYVLDKGYFPTEKAIKQADNLSLLNPNPVKFKDGDKLIELKTVFLLFRS